MRLLAAIDEKAKGEEIQPAPAPAPQSGHVIDLMEALKKSLTKAPAGEKRESQRKRGHG